MSLSYARLLARRVYRSLWFTPAAYAVLAVLALLRAPALAVLLPEEFHKLIGLDGVDDLLTPFSHPAQDRPAPADDVTGGGRHGEQDRARCGEHGGRGHPHLERVFRTVRRHQGC